MVCIGNDALIKCVKKNMALLAVIIGCSKLLLLRLHAISSQVVRKKAQLVHTFRHLRFKTRSL